MVEKIIELELELDQSFEEEDMIFPVWVGVKCFFRGLELVDGYFQIFILKKKLYITNQRL